MIEAEIRSFVSKDKYDELKEFFLRNATLVKEDVQESIYFDCDEDLRIQKNNFYSKVWMKDFVELLNEYDLYRLLPDGPVALGPYRPLTHEIFGFQNIVAIKQN